MNGCVPSALVQWVSRGLRATQSKRSNILNILMSQSYRAIMAYYFFLWKKYNIRVDAPKTRELMSSVSRGKRSTKISRRRDFEDLAIFRITLSDNGICRLGVVISIYLDRVWTEFRGAKLGAAQRPSATCSISPDIPLPTWRWKVIGIAWICGQAGDDGSFVQLRDLTRGKRPN